MFDNDVKWSRYGGYECSSKGDKRFSPLFATMPDGRTIEAHYQCDVKGYNPGGTNWKAYKGKPPQKSLTRDQLWQCFLSLWIEWSLHNKELVLELRSIASEHDNLLSDGFAATEINQARALAHILNNIEVIFNDFGRSD